MFKNLLLIDPYMLLSIVNTKLRDFNPSLKDFCRHYDVDEQQLQDKLKTIGYCYENSTNQFKVIRD